MVQEASLSVLMALGRRDWNEEDWWSVGEYAAGSCARLVRLDYPYRCLTVCLCLAHVLSGLEMVYRGETPVGL